MGGKRPRLATFDYLGSYRYLLTFCTAHRRPAFSDVATVELVLSQILRVAGREHFAVLAYCFMPDHLHLLVEGRCEDADFRKFAQAAKQASGFADAKRARERLWQPSYHDRVLRDAEATLTVARYVVANPVRVWSHPLKAIPSSGLPS